MPIAINAASGAGTGIAIAGGAGASVNVAATSFGSTAYGANLSVSGATGATGVTLTGVAGANAVTFSGARLDVASGRDGFGHPGDGGTNVTVAMLPAGGSATLTVSGAGAARGAMLGRQRRAGRDVRRQRFRDLVGSRRDRDHDGRGNFADVDAVEGTDGQRRRGHRDRRTAPGHGQRDDGPRRRADPGHRNRRRRRRRISATGSGGLTVDGAPAITVSGGNIITGIAAVASSGPISLATGAITVSSTSNSAASTGVGPCQHQWRRSRSPPPASST